MINLDLAYKVFFYGLSLGFGTCFSSCGPIICSYVFGTKSNIKEAIKKTLIFGAGKFLGYLVLGAVAGLSGKLAHFIFYQKFGMYVEIVIGICVLIIAISIIMGSGLGMKNCEMVHHKAGQRNLFILGLITGIAPCVPLIGIFSYIILESKNIGQGIFYFVLFGIGNFLSPLLLVGPLAGLLAQVNIFKKIQRYLQLIGGAILVYMSIEYIIPSIIGLVIGQRVK